MTLVTWLQPWTKEDNISGSNSLTMRSLISSVLSKNTLLTGSWRFNDLLTLFAVVVCIFLVDGVCRRKKKIYNVLLLAFRKCTFWLGSVDGYNMSNHIFVIITFFFTFMQFF